MILVAQVDPVYPGGQVQVKELIPSVHDPPFKHGLGEHSLILVAHKGPEYPGRQVQLNEFMPSTQVAPFRH